MGQARILSTSRIVDRALRKRVGPLLQEAGFTTINARNAWAWHEKLVWVFSMRAVGSYFSLVTGWPPGSIEVRLGIFFLFTPRHFPVKTDAQNRLLPAEPMCHMRTPLERGLNQDEYMGQLTNATERQRRDLWWVEPDASNSTAVAEDIAVSFSQYGVSWFSSNSDLATALVEIESGPDCFLKFDTAAFLAREIEDYDRWQRYAALTETEAKRIDYPIDPKTRYGI